MTTSMEFALEDGFVKSLPDQHQIEPKTSFESQISEYSQKAFENHFATLEKFLASFWKDVLNHLQNISAIKDHLADLSYQLWNQSDSMYLPGDSLEIVVITGSGDLYEQLRDSFFESVSLSLQNMGIFSFDKKFSSEGQFFVGRFSFILKLAFRCKSLFYLVKNNKVMLIQPPTKFTAEYATVIRFCKLLARDWQNLPPNVIDAVASSLQYTQLPSNKEGLQNSIKYFLVNMQNAIKNNTLCSPNDPLVNISDEIGPETVQELLKWTNSTLATCHDPFKLMNHLSHLWNEFCQRTETPHKRPHDFELSPKKRKKEELLTKHNLPQAILELFETEEELEQYLALYNSSSQNNNTKKKVLNPRQAVHRRVQREIRKLKKCMQTDSDLRTTHLMYYRTRSGWFCPGIDFRPEATKPFGVHFLQRVSTDKGLATILGVWGGNLFFQLDKDRGASYWDNINDHNDLLRMGITVLADQTPCQSILTKIAEALVSTSQLSLLRITSMIEWTDVKVSEQEKLGSKSGANVSLSVKSKCFVKTFFEPCIKCGENSLNHKLCVEEATQLAAYFKDTNTNRIARLNGKVSYNEYQLLHECQIHSYYGKFQPKPVLQTTNPSFGFPEWSPQRSPTVPTYPKSSTPQPKQLPCPFCYVEFSTEYALNEHAMTCEKFLKQTPNDKFCDNNLPQTELDIDSAIQYENWKMESARRSLKQRESTSRVAPLWSVTLKKIVALGPDTVEQAFLMSQQLGLIESISTVLKNKYFEQIKPQLLQLTMEQWMTISRADREILLLKHLKDHPETLTKPEKLAVFVNVNLSLDHKDVMNVLKKHLTTDVLVSLFEVIATSSELLECDALKSYIISELTLLKLQDSKTFCKLNVEMQNVLIKACTQDNKIAECYENRGSEDLMDLTDMSFDPWDEVPERDEDEEQDSGEDMEEEEE